MAVVALGGQSRGGRMGWSAEHVVHPLETGPEMHWDLVQPLLSVCLPVSSHLWPPFFPSWKEVYLAGKETPLTVALRILESERRGNFNSWGLSPLSLKIFSFPKNLGSFCFLSSWSVFPNLSSVKTLFCCIHILCSFHGFL